MITDEESLKDALRQINSDLHASILRAKRQVAPGVDFQFTGTITGTDYLIPDEPVLNISSTARIIVDGQPTTITVGDYE